MPSVMDDVSEAVNGLNHHQRYTVDVPGVANASALSVVSFEATERLGEAYRVSVMVTHPERLSRHDYLGRNACFHLFDRMPDSVAEEAPPLTFNGCITAFHHRASSRDEHRYELVIEPHVARLNMVHASRVFQKQSAPAIIEAILRRHELQGHQFDFKLRRTYPEHAFHLQYQCSDWDYIDLLMRQEGIYSYFTTGKHGDVLVFADDVDHYLYQPSLTLAYREQAGLNAAEPAIITLETHTHTVPQSFAVADYNPRQSGERFKADANVARKDRTTYGQPYVYGSGHLNQSAAQWEAQLRHEAALAGQVVYAGQSTAPGLRPARVLHTDSELPDAPHGMVLTEVIHRGARDAAYGNTFQAIPVDRRYRLPLHEANWPRIAGTLSARVTALPGNEKYASLTPQGHYTVRFDLDFDAWNPGGESVPLRLAKPFAGALQTGMHFPVVADNEAIIAFRDGDPNKPYIAAFQHHSHATDLITAEDRRMSKNVIRTQSDNKLELEDWEGQEHAKLSTEHSGKSQLTLGHIVDGKRTKRGEGVELRTGAHVAVRGGKGVFISADDQPAHGPQLAMAAALAQLQQALLQTEALSEAAQVAQAAAADYDRQRTLLDNTLNQLKQAGVLVSAPAGIGVVSASDLQLSAAKNLIATAGHHADISVMKRFTLAAGELVSVFAQKLGIKLIAAKGKVQIQAQRDAMQLMADQDVTVTSVNGRVTIEAKNELILKCGGSYLRMTSTGIEDGTRGDRTFKAATHYRQGPSSVAEHMNSLSKVAFNDPYVLRSKITGEPLKQHPYEVMRGDGSFIKGVTNDMGQTVIQKSHDVENMIVRVLKK